jgi:hypothetical protein
MAAKDYQICTGLFNAYIAKVRKKRPNMMTDDRRVITEGEILMLIDWYLDNELDEEHDTLSFESQEREGKRVQLKFIDNEKGE